MGKGKESTPLITRSDGQDSSADAAASTAGAGAGSGDAGSSGTTAKASRLFLASLLIGVIIAGTGNKVALKLMTYPMANYLYFLSVLTSVIYLPLFFGAVWYKLKFTDHITDDMIKYPKRKFAVMGALDAVAGVLVVFGSAHIPGPMTVLLSQGAIPVTMIFSFFLLKMRYHWRQYLGSVIIFGGILVTLLPPILTGGGGGGDALWTCLFFLATVPTALSSIYKELAFKDQPMDAYYLNAWVAVFQVLVQLLFAVPCAPVQGIAISQIPENFANGAKCYFTGQNSIKSCDGEGSDCVVDDCPKAGPFVTIYMVFNIAYNILLVMILKFGSATLMFVASAVVIPLANICFTFKFIMGEHATQLRITDIAGLIVILIGLGLYRSVRGGDDEGGDKGTAVMPGLGPAGAEMVRPLRVHKTVLLENRSVRQIRSGYYTRLGLAPPLTRPTNLSGVV
eukprot:ANDGO_06385.mRNA.1 Crt homolog 1